MTVAPAVPVVLIQHAEEAAFLWTLRTHAVSQPHYALADLCKLDMRISAHLDGLCVAGVAGKEITKHELVQGGPGEVFVAEALALSTEDFIAARELLDNYASDPELFRPLVSAIGWLPSPQAAMYIGTLSSSETLRHVSLAAAAIHRLDPRETLKNAVIDRESPLHMRALRAVGELGRLDLLALAKACVDTERTEVRLWAAWSVAVLSKDVSALRALSDVLRYDVPHRKVGVEALMRRSDLGTARAWQHAMAQEADTADVAVRAAGAMGDAAAIPWLIDQMKIAELARLAGESFTTITGVDLGYQDLEGGRPNGFESGPSEDPADENVEMDPDENLPWPDPKLIQKWWQSNRHAFQSGTRYLFGKPITVEWCKQVLRIGRQRQRSAAALELAMRQPGIPLFEVRAPGFRQKQQLGL